MVFLEILCMVFLLFFVMYGITQAAGNLGTVLLRPKATALFTVLWLQGHNDDTEEQLRFAQWIAQQCHTRLLIVEDEIEAFDRGVMERMMPDGDGVRCTAQEFEKIARTACNELKKRV